MSGTNEKRRKARLVLARDAQGLWAWRLKSGNGRLLLQSAGFVRRTACLKDFWMIEAAARDHDFVELPPHRTVPDE